MAGPIGYVDKPKVDRGTKAMTQHHPRGARGREHVENDAWGFANSPVGQFVSQLWKLLNDVMASPGDYRIMLRACMKGGIDPSTWVAEREERRETLIDAQDEALEQFPPTPDGESHCSEGALCVAVLTDAPYIGVLGKQAAPTDSAALADWIRVGKGGNFYRANEQADRLAVSDEYVKVSPVGGQWLANGGVPVFVVQKHKGKGHIASIRPISRHEFAAAYGAAGLLLANVGPEHYGKNDKQYSGHGVLRESAVFKLDPKAPVVRGAEAQIFTYAPLELAAEAIRGVAWAMEHGEFSRRAMKST